MSNYNPKRPVPNAGLDGDEPAPVDALIDGARTGEVPAVPAGGESTPAAEPKTPAAEPKASTPTPPIAAAAPRPEPREVPVAPAPNSGTVNRAVVIAAATLGVAGLLVLVLLRRRRS